MRLHLNRDTPAPSLPAIILFAASLCLIGCEQSPYSNVSGAVTYKGQPVPNGEIRLTPDSNQGNVGPAVVAMIKDGTYATREGKGIVGGKYQVRIMGYKARIQSDDPTAPEFGPPLFKTQTQFAEFPPGEDCVHDIVLE